MTLREFFNGITSDRLIFIFVQGRIVMFHGLPGKFTKCTAQLPYQGLMKKTKSNPGLLSGLDLNAASNLRPK